MRFHVGARVQLKGLVKAAEHNGKYGSVVGSHGEERIKVKLLGEEKTLAVKEANLEEVVDGEEPATDDDDDEKKASDRPSHQQLEEDDEVCPLCLVSLPSEVEDFFDSKTYRFACCGKRLCATCNPKAERQLGGTCPLCRQTLPRTLEEAYESIRKQAVHGRPWACYKLGDAYESGKSGVPQNDKLDYEWFRKAANKGSIPAYHRLGQCYEHGRGVNQSDQLASEWYGKAADAGFALSQLKCAKMYLDDDVIHKDVSEGIRLLQLAAEQGYSAAEATLGACYYEGLGVECSPRSAITWDLKAAQHNNYLAQHYLGVHLIKLYGDKAAPAAMFWFRRAAAQGHTDSVTTLANMEKVIAESSCANCGAAGGPKRRCSRCRTVSYCSEKCQKAHWKKSHKTRCCDQDMAIKDFEFRKFDYLK